jgi:hypothetical protein
VSFSEAATAIDTTIDSRVGVTYSGAATDIEQLSPNADFIREHWVRSAKNRQKYNH